MNRAEVQISENAAAAPLRKSSVHVVTAITAIFLLIASVLACVLGSIAVTNSVRARGNGDLVEYWAAGAQLVHHQNPYDIPSDLRLESFAGADFSSPLVIFNPPFILPLLAPLGLMSAKAASEFWLTLNLAALGVSLWLIWQTNGKPPATLLLLGLLFAPVFRLYWPVRSGYFFYFPWRYFSTWSGPDIWGLPGSL